MANLGHPQGGGLLRRSVIRADDQSAAFVRRQRLERDRAAVVERYPGALGSSADE